MPLEIVRCLQSCQRAVAGGQVAVRSGLKRSLHRVVARNHRRVVRLHPGRHERCGLAVLLEPVFPAAMPFDENRVLPRRKILRGRLAEGCKGSSVVCRRILHPIQKSLDEHGIGGVGGGQAKFEPDPLSPLAPIRSPTVSRDPAEKANA